MPDEMVNLSEQELKLIALLAEQRGISLEEAASQFVQEALAKRVRRKTGHGPARVYQIPRRKQ